LNASLIKTTSAISSAAPAKIRFIDRLVLVIGHWSLVTGH
jgi:hypothetical protein